MADKVRQGFGRADILLHLVGTYRGGGFAETTGADWQQLFETNLWTAVCVFGAFLPLLRESDRGRVIAVSSPYAQAPSGTSVAYASKAALEALVLSLGAELKGRARDADHRDAQSATRCEAVQRRKQLLARQIASGAE